MRTTILFCVGQAAASAPKLDLKSKLNEISQKFIMPDLKSANTELKVNRADGIRAKNKLKHIQFPFF